ncbi:NAD(P)/FAD-dependent oxidoreductase [Rhodoligotrophos appendicifer]|uniref:NAD(P)/FAD-dependent oxidoreductase n=1 Tax=Rhodoligotrophos appendicifer TaxID=987056 RepID=UPI001180EC5F|nr:FAD-binding oxidoreductase [Rhodoligotrophos appendicifer]
MLNDLRSHGLWEMSAAPAPSTASLVGDLSADVVIIGGGFTGLSAALHLASSGTNAVVLEGVEIGFGASGRNAGLVNAGLWLPPAKVMEGFGPTYGDRMLTLLGDAPKLVFDIIERNQISCEVQRSGTLHCAVGAAGVEELEQRTEQWAARGAAVRLLDAEETAAKTGTTVFSASLLDDRAGTIQPLGYVRGLARAAINAGAQVFTNSPVIGADRQGTKWVVKTSSGTVTADWILVATNSYTVSPWNEIRAELVVLSYFQFATTPLEGKLLASILPERQGAWDTRQVLSSFRFDKAGRLIVGSVGALQGTGATVHEAWARRAIRKLFPDFGPIEFEAGWYGRIGMTSDDLPRLHRLDHNVISFSGDNGRGIGPGTAFGRVLAQYINGAMTEDDLPMPITDPKSQSFGAIREAYYELGAQAAHFVDARF